MPRIVGIILGIGLFFAGLSGFLNQLQILELEKRIKVLEAADRAAKGELDDHQRQRAYTAGS